MSVAQLERNLNADYAARKPDAEIARQIRSIELSERLTDATLERLKEHFPVDSQTATALSLLAELSAFLDLPTNELPTTPAPDAATQQQLLEAAQRFALQTLPRLPNLLATKTTLSFDDSPQELTKGGYLQRIGLHLVSTSKEEVSVRSEENPSKTTTHAQAQDGLVTWGEFGSALLIILSDSSHGKMTWSHWEQTSSGQVSVFHYEVPKTASHYEIVTPVVRSQPGLQTDPSAATGGVLAMTARSTTTMVPTKPGYHGSLWVNPKTGSTLRVSLVADLSGNSIFSRGAILVEYAPVKIADRTYICPVHSLALSLAPPTVNSTFEGATTEWLNENLFTNYHIFAATSRILVGGAAATSGTPDAKAVGAAPNQVALESSAAGAPLSELASGVQPQSTPVVPPTALQGENVEKDQPEPPIVGTTAVVDANPSRNSSPAPPNLPIAGASAVDSSQTPAATQPTAAPDSEITLRLEVSELPLPVVVRGKDGHAVGDLSQDDFTVLDRRKMMRIASFAVMKSGAVTDVEEPRANAVGRAVSHPSEDRFVVLLVDDRHLNASDLSYVQAAATKLIDESAVETSDMGVVSFTGINSGITRDRPTLKAAIMKLKSHPIFQYGDHDSLNIDAHTAYQIIDQRDTQVFQLAVAQTKSSSHLMVTGQDNVFENMVLSAANRALVVGQEDARESLNIIDNVIHAMAKLPGQRTLILISPGFFSDSPETMYFKSQTLNQAAIANVVISALDARGMVVDTAGNDHVMAELAAGTGGTFFDHSNDLAAGLQGLTIPPEFLYLLELSLQGVKPDGTYHQLQVKVDKRGLDVQARKGYFAGKPENARK